MAFWLTIPGYDGGNGIGAAFSLPSSYITQPKLEYRSQEPDLFRFSYKGAACDENAFAAEGTICTLSTDATGTLAPLLVGELFWIPRSGDPGAESIDYEIRGPWQMLAENTMQQQWNFITSFDESGNPTTAAQDTAHLLLGVDIEGNPLTNGQVIEEIIGWAITLGLPVQLGAIDSTCDAPIPVDDVHDLPMAECLRKMLRFTPDAVAWWDYTRTLDGLPCPAFNVTRRPNCAALNLPFAPADGSRVNIKARTDMQREHVVIRYEQENKTDNQPVIALIIDDYPGGSSGREPKALVSTMKLAGANATYEKQPVITQPISTGNDNDSTDASGFLQFNIPELAQFDFGRLSVTNISAFVLQTDPGPNGAANNDWDIADYPNQLISGSIPDWVKSQGIRTAEITLTCTVSYLYPEEDDGDSNNAFLLFGPGQGDPGAVTGWCNQRQYTVTVKGTNASATTYTQLSSYEEPEPVPYGLAQTLYDTWSVLQYEGIYSTVDQEIARQPLGIVVNLTGSRAEWQTMNALVQAIEFDLETGATTFRFGWAEQLTAQDLMEQLRATRQRRVSAHIRQRTTGQPGNPQVNGAGQTQRGQGAPTQPATAYPWIDFIDDYDDPASGQAMTWDALQGYGQSDFANDIGHAGPLEKFELSVGNDDSDWPDQVNSIMSTLPNVASIVSGAAQPDEDWAWFGRTDDSGKGGSVLIRGYGNNQGASVYLSQNLYPLNDGTGDPFISLDLGTTTILVQDGDGAQLSMDLSDDPTFVATLGDDYSATLGNSELEIQTSDGYADLTPGDLYLQDSATGGAVDIDASSIDGGHAYFQLLELCNGADTVSAYFLMTEPT